MFKNFKFASRNDKITGYIWEVEEPVKVLCIIHGIGEHIGRYERLAKFLSEKNIAIIGMDHRGHGLSDGIRGDAAPRKDVIEDIDAMLLFAKEKYPQSPIVLYGHSLGGNICLDYNARGNYNDLPEKYIVSAPWISLVKEVSKPLYKTMKLLGKIKPKLTIDNGCKREDLGNPKNLLNYEKDKLIHGRVSVQTALDGYEFAESLLKGTNENNGKTIDIPLLLMHGDADRICSVNGSRTFAKQNENKPNFEYIEWKGYFHEIHNGGLEKNGDEVLEKIRDYILG